MSRLQVNKTKLEEMYQEWRGNASCYDNGKPVFEADELIDFTEFCLKHEANVLSKSTNKCSLENVSKRFWHFDCWDRTGKMQTITIEALNEENATIIFKAKHEDLGFDPPY